MKSLEEKREYLNILKKAMGLSKKDISRLGEKAGYSHYISIYMVLNGERATKDTEKNHKKLDRLIEVFKEENDNRQEPI